MDRVPHASFQKRLRAFVLSHYTGILSNSISTPSEGQPAGRGLRISANQKHCHIPLRDVLKQKDIIPNLVTDFWKKHQVLNHSGSLPWD